MADSIIEGYVYRKKIGGGAYLAIKDDEFGNDGFNTFFDFITGKTVYLYNYEVEKMQSDYALEYLFCDMTIKYPDWEDKVVEAVRDSLDMNIFKIYIDSFMDTSKSFNDLNQHLVFINDSFLGRLDVSLESKGMFNYEYVERLRRHHKLAIDYLYQKAVLIV